MAQPSAIESDYFVPNTKITVLIRKIEIMSKHPNVESVESELSKVLDEFLEKLGECDKYLQNGIFNMNFAEAALLLQSSADLYSKKVDVLWDIIFDYQKRLLLSEEQNGETTHEMEKVEERKRKYKRKRKTNVDESQTAKLVNNFSFGNAENIDYLNQNSEMIDLSQEWQKFNLRNTSCDNVGHISNKSFIFLPNNIVHNEDNDYIGRYDQFHSMSLIDEIFHLESQKLLTDDHNCITNMRLDSYAINDFLLEKSIPSNVSIDSYSKQLKEYVTQFSEAHKQLKNEPSTQNACRQSFVCLERLPFNVMRKKLRRSSLADSLFDDDQMDSEFCSSPALHDPKNGEEQVSKNLETRSKSCSQDSAFFEDEDHSEVEADSSQEHPSESLPAASVNETDKSSSIVQETVTNDLNTKSIENINGEIDSTGVIDTVTASSVETTTLDSTVENCNVVTEITKEQLEENPVNKRNRPVQKWSSLLDISSENEEHEVKRRKVVVKKVRISEKALKKLSTGITVMYRDFEIFCRLQYKSAIDEGIVPQNLSDVEESDDNMSSDDDDEHEPASPLPSEGEESNHQANDDEHEDEPTIPLSPICASADVPPNMGSDLNQPTYSGHGDPRIMGMTSTPCRPERRQNLSFNLSEAELEQEDSCRKNVREWRNFIVPKLKSLENRADFDIHEYGSKIIEPSQIGEQRHFKDIVKGKNAAEVARYLIATLQLANTHNVEIIGAVAGKVANDTFQIKILDKTKHHELLEEYQAPSEETFKERLQRAKALTPNFSQASTSRVEPASKKLKLGNYSKKKLF